MMRYLLLLLLAACVVDDNIEVTDAGTDATDGDPHNESDMSILHARPQFDHLFIMGDSIVAGTGAGAISNRWVERLRANWPRTFTDDAAAGRRLMTYVNTAPARAAYVAVVTARRPTHIWIELSTNDYGSPLNTKADFITYYRAFVEDIHAVLPMAKIYCQSAMYRYRLADGLDMSNIPNTGGDTLDDYRAAVQTACAGLQYARFVDFKNTVSVANMYDHAHPNAAGHLQLYNATKAVIQWP